MIVKYKCLNRAISHDVTSAILVFQTNEKVPMLVFQTSPLGLLFQKIFIAAGQASKRLYFSFVHLRNSRP